jgi:hypothetical protein
MATYDLCITHSLNLYRSRNKLNQTNESNSVDKTDSQFQHALDQKLSLDRWDPCMHLGVSCLIHAMRRRGFLKTRGSAPLLFLPRHLALGSRSPHELWHGRDVEFERPGGGGRIGAAAPHLGLGGRRADTRGGLTPPS